MVWLSVSECAAITNEDKSTVRRKALAQKYNSRIVIGNGGEQYEILLSSLPLYAQTKYASDIVAAMDCTVDQKTDATHNTHNNMHNIDDSMHAYNAAPSYARAFADKWVVVLQETDCMSRKEIDAYVAYKKQLDSTLKISRSRIYVMRKRYQAGGLSGLLPGWGKNSGTSNAPELAYDIFKNSYLKEGAPSAESCYIQAWGEYKLKNPEAEFCDFPSRRTFLRRIEKEIPKEALFKARYGNSRWKKSFQSYIERDFSGISAGEIWVSDHAQIDVAVRLDDGSVHFPWFTAWRDFKSGLILGWMIEIGAGNSDRIFQTFYYAASAYGLPSVVIIDNGKDYRSKDFAGGRKKVNIGVSESKANSMLSKLGVKAHFALPYNSQTKNIERDFRTIKEYFSKNMVGYRGGNVTERPEILKKEIKNQSIMHFDDFKPLFQMFIDQVFHVMPCGGKLKGKSRLEAFNNDFKVKRIVSPDALMLFCMRVSDPVTIGRNGVYDNKLDEWYWGEWMAGVKGTKVYMRRDPLSYQDAYVFDAANDCFLGKARIGKFIAAAYAKSEVEKAKLMEALRNKKQAQKFIDKYITRVSETPAEVITRMAVGMNGMTQVLNINENTPTLQLTHTEMDSVINDANTTHDVDLSSIVPTKSAKKNKIKLFEVEF